MILKNINHTNFLFHNDLLNSTMTEKIPIIVMDNGSGTSKIGFSGQNSPCSIFPTIIGRPKYLLGPDSDLKDLYVGEEALDQSEFLDLIRPIESRKMSDYDNIEALWNYTFFEQLKIEPTNYGVIVTESPLLELEHRNKLAQIMFEQFNVKSFFIANSPSMALLSIGQQNGVVADMGYDSALISSVIDGIVVNDSSILMKIGGKDLTNYLQKILLERCLKIEEYADVNEIKEKLCYVAHDFDAEITKSQTSSECDSKYGNLDEYDEIVISNERFRCPEILFQPHFCGHSSDGVDQLIMESILQCPEEKKTDLLNNILITGGSSLFLNMAERIERCLKKMPNPPEQFNIHSPKDRQYSVWTGTSIFASSPTYDQTAITKEEYDDIGISLVCKKCT